MSLEGKQLGRYQLRRLLGSGGMGEVYLGEDPRIGQQIAIKVIRAEISSYASTQEVAEAKRLFLREATAVARLDHPHILPLYDFGEATIDGANVTYLVMPFRPDGSFADWLQRRNSAEPLPLEDVAYFLAQMAGALQYVHDRQIVHRDVKPSNFLIRENKEQPSRPDLLLTDFGLAQILGTTAVSLSPRGTPNYMAPEQWEGHPVPATDQYALGIIAYELLTGQLVFQGSVQQMMYHHLNTLPQPPSQINHHLPSSVDAILARALAKRPEERYPSIATFAQVLQQALPGTAESAGGEVVGTNRPATQLEGMKSVSQHQPEISVTPGLTPDSWQFTMTMRPSEEAFRPTEVQGIGQPLPPTAPVYLGQTPAPATPPPPRQPATPPEDPKLEQPGAPFTPATPPIASTPTPSVQEQQRPSQPGTPTPPPVWVYPPPTSGGQVTPVSGALPGQTPPTPGGQVPSGGASIPPGWVYLPTPEGQVPPVAGAPPGWGYPPTPSGPAAGAPSGYPPTPSGPLPPTASTPPGYPPTPSRPLPSVTPPQALQVAPPTPPGGPPSGRRWRPDWTRRISPFLAVALIGLVVLILGGTVLAGILLSRSGSPPPPRPWQTVIDDPLSDNSQNNGWDESSYCQFSNGAYYVRMDQTGKYEICANKKPFSNFSFQVQMVIKEGDCGGVTFRSNPASGSGYTFGVCQDGKYFLLRQDSSNQSPQTIKESSSSSIHSGLNKTNALGVKAEGSQISLYINGQLIFSTNADKTYSEGLIGMIAYPYKIVPTVVGYTNAKVEVPPK